MLGYAGRDPSWPRVGGEVVYLMARGRLVELMAAARESLSGIAPGDNESEAAFQAGCATSRAAGFLEAVTLLDPEHADEMVSEFESVAAMVEDLRARFFSGVPAPGPDAT